MLSTSENPEDLAKAKEIGSDGFMAKPLTKLKIKDLIKKHFPEVYKTWNKLLALVSFGLIKFTSFY